MDLMGGIDVLCGTPRGEPAQLSSEQPVYSPHAADVVLIRPTCNGPNPKDIIHLQDRSRAAAPWGNVDKSGTKAAAGSGWGSQAGTPSGAGGSWGTQNDNGKS